MNDARELLLGAEAIACAAIDEGISGVYAYPGTPSTEITEYIQQSEEARTGRVRAAWSVNEKTAYEAALGMSYAGKRSMVCMKHVGLNVAADAFMNSAVTGIKGGMVVVVADDPSMHSSQNEQDTRYYGRFAQLPLLEPSNQQEAYDCVRYAFVFSEKMALPVIVRITTRLSHSRSTLVRRTPALPNPLAPDTDCRKWILLPANARRQYQFLLDLQPALVEASEQSPFNFIREATGAYAPGNEAGSQKSKSEAGQNDSATNDKAGHSDSATGIIAFGLAYNYVMEVNTRFDLQLPVLKISHYPLPERMVRSFTGRFERIIVVEEGYPIYEELLKGFFGNSKFSGRLDATLPRTGELTPDALIQALVPSEMASAVPVPPIVAARPPELCQGCGHRDLYDALNEAIKEPATYTLNEAMNEPAIEAINHCAHHPVFADIGCYTLGALPPYNAINTCVDMGASVTMAKGAADAGLHPAVAVIGDSTFTHSGITGLLDAVNDRTAITIIISDNYTTAMTGGQTSGATGRIQAICEGIGVDPAHIRTIIPLKKNHVDNVSILKEELAYRGVSVVIACRECIQTARRRNRNV
jgi:indolepyruvate ferredoxin oxidoreductase alpha subunit